MVFTAFISVKSKCIWAQESGCWLCPPRSHAESEVDWSKLNHGQTTVLGTWSPPPPPPTCTALNYCKVIDDQNINLKTQRAIKINMIMTKTESLSATLFVWYLIFWVVTGGTSTDCETQPSFHPKSDSICSRLLQAGLAWVHWAPIFAHFMVLMTTDHSAAANFFWKYPNLFKFQENIEMTEH